MSEWREERKPEWEKRAKERIEEEAKILTDLVWNYWKQLLHGREPEKPTYKELRGVAEYFLRKCREYGVAPEAVDFMDEIAELGATYGEMKEKIDTLLPRFADHRARLEEMAEALRREEKALEKAKKEAKREQVRRLEKRIKKLKEALEEELKKEREERAYLEKRVKELSEELKAKKVKLRFLKDYPPFYKAGMVIETADLPWAFELINSGVAEYVLPPKPKVEAVPVRRGLGYAEKQRLETRFFAELARRGIGVNEAKKRGYYQMFLDEFESWREDLKEVPSEKALEAALKLIASLADEIEKIHRAPKPKVRKAPPPTAPPAPIPPAPTPTPAPVISLPPKPLCKLPFPRRPCSEEKDIIKRVFDQELSALGLMPSRYYTALRERIYDWTFKSWDEVVKEFKELIEDIRLDRVKIRPPLLPWKNKEEAIKHLFAARYGTAEAIAETLTLDYNLPTTKDEVVRVIVESWRKKENPLYADLTEKELMRRLGVSTLGG